MEQFTYEELQKVLKFCHMHLTESEIHSILKRPVLTERAKERQTEELSEDHRRLLGTPVKAKQ